jgi:hypothetical protein
MEDFVLTVGMLAVDKVIVARIGYVSATQEAKLSSATAMHTVALAVHLPCIVVAPGTFLPAKALLLMVSAQFECISLLSRVSAPKHKLGTVCGSTHASTLLLCSVLPPTSFPSL